MKTQKFSVTVPADIIAKVKQLAAKQDRTVSKMTSILLAQALAAYVQPHTDKVET